MDRLIAPDQVQEAVEEIGTKGDYGIERETAIKWGARYVAALELGKAEAEVYFHEAIEHAAETHDLAFFSQLMTELLGHR